MHDRAVSKMEKLKTKIPSLVSYESFPQKTTDFSSHTLQKQAFSSLDPTPHFPAEKGQLKQTQSP